MSRLDYLRDLYALRQVSSGVIAGFDTNRLANSFLAFSTCAPKKSLSVKLPKMYLLNGDQTKKYAEGLALLGLESIEAPRAIDISGAFDRHSLDDAIIIASLKQLGADQFCSTRAYLNPLLEKNYTEGAGMIRDFTIHEVLVGRIKRSQGDLELQDVPLFPERLTAGPYKLVVELGTPKRTVQRCMDLHAVLERMAKDSQDCILNPELVQNATAEAVDLRKRLGALSRYDAPKTRVFQAPTNSCVIRSRKNTLFYLYVPEHNKNVLVYFGESPFPEGNTPKDLLVFSGKQHQYALEKLLELGVFEPSQQVLKQRIKDVGEFYDNAVRGRGVAVKDSEINRLLDELKKADQYMNEVLNPDMRRTFVSRLSPEVCEFMIYPATNDPVVHELLPRLSWNKHVRTYNNTDKFMHVFESSNDVRRAEMLSEAVSNVLFRNWQNNDVNVWLYQNHKDFCVKNGIKFELIK